jgi:hypothetical protein
MPPNTSPSDHCDGEKNKRERVGEKRKGRSAVTGARANGKDRRDLRERAAEKGGDEPPQRREKEYEAARRACRNKSVTKRKPGDMSQFDRDGRKENQADRKTRDQPSESITGPHAMEFAYLGLSSS